MNIQEIDQQIFGQLTTEKLCTILNPNCILSTPISVLFRSENMNGIVSRNFFKTAISKLLLSFSRVSFIGWKNKYQIVLEQIMKNDLNLISYHGILNNLILFFMNFLLNTQITYDYKNFRFAVFYYGR